MERDPGGGGTLRWVLALIATVLVDPEARAADACNGKGTALYVNADRHEMRLCEENRTIRVLRVALGQGGVGKRVQGDGKLPVGEYPLGEPRASRSYHLFVPVGYPTERQRRAGFTGSAIGVHGPPRGFKGPASTDTDWTLGCIAVGTDEEIERVAGWIRGRRVRRIVIRER